MYVHKPRFELLVHLSQNKSDSRVLETEEGYEECMCANQDSNLGPLEYQSSALPAELFAQT